MPTSFQNVVCWSLDEARHLLTPQALHLSDAAFAAVHLPVPLRYKKGTGGVQGADGEGSFDEVDFLADLRQAAGGYRLVPVVGPSGTGKSHLVRWLEQQLTRTGEPGRCVVLVPRALTNLRGIVQKLLKGLPEDRAQHYRDKLAAAVEPQSDEEGRGRLLRELAHAIQYAPPLDLASDDPDAQGLAFAVGQVPNLLSDVHLAEHYWLRPGGVIERLYEQALGTATFGDAEAPLGFSAADLPLSGIAANKAASVVQGFLGLLHQESVQAAVLRLLNEHLDTAVQRMLNFHGDDLTSLLRDVRRHFAGKGEDVVLLIEDVSRLQGLDRALLEALVETPDASLGTAGSAFVVVIGVTDGYYEQYLPDNFHQRESYTVWTDVPEKALSVQRLAARYLNASRLPAEAVASWYAAGNALAPLRSACHGCPFQGPCHDTFGAEDGVGYYPFTADTLGRMYSRLDRTITQGVVPRYVLQDVLQPVLVEEASAIGAGEAPRSALYQHFGGEAKTAWTLAERARIQALPDGARVTALMDLWGGLPAPGKLDRRIYEAFDVRVPTLTGPPIPPKPEPVPPVVGTPPPPLPLAPISPLVDALHAWAGGSKLPQSPTTDLRKHLHRHVMAYVDWNALGVYPASVRTYWNESTGFYFKNQALPKGNFAVQVELPLPGWSPAETSVALQGMVLADLHGGFSNSTGQWRFADAPLHLAAWARLLSDIEASLRGELAKVSSSKPWNPARAGIELLVLGARLHGLPLSSHTSAAEKQDALFVPWAEATQGTAAWRSVLKEFRDRQGALREIVRDFGLSAKGNSGTTMTLDAASWLDILRRVSLEPKERIPQNPGQVFGNLTRLHTVATQVAGALTAEEVRWATVRAALSSGLRDSPASEIHETVQATVAALIEAGHLTTGTQRHTEWQTAQGAFRPGEVDTLRARLAALDTEADGEKIFEGEPETTAFDSARLRRVGHLGELSTSAHHATRYVDATRQLLGGAWTRMADNANVLGEQVEALAHAQGAACDAVRQWGRLAGLAGAQTEPGSPSDENVQGGTHLDVSAEVPAAIDRLAREVRALSAHTEKESQSAALAKQFRGIADALAEDAKAWELQDANAAVLAKISVRVDMPEASLLATDVKPLIEAIASPEALAHVDLGETLKRFQQRRKAFLDQRTEAIQSAWTAHVREQAPVAPSDLVKTFQKLGPLAAAARGYADAAARVSALEGGPPAPAALATAVADLQTAWQALAGGAGNLPDEVSAFVRSVGAGGAALALYTPTVDAWLAARGLGDVFVVRLRAL